MMTNPRIKTVYSHLHGELQARSEADFSGWFCTILTHVSRLEVLELHVEGVARSTSLTAFTPPSELYSYLQDLV